MKAQELRIGNYVNLNGNDVISVMGDIQEICYEEVSPKYINEYKPIPLTEEWLLKADKTNEALMVDKIGFVIFKAGYAHQFIRDDYKYVHLFQNLFYALTGEELQA